MKYRKLTGTIVKFGQPKYDSRWVEIQAPLPDGDIVKATVPVPQEILRNYPPGVEVEFSYKIVIPEVE